jgi:hypothetical protein
MFGMTNPADAAMPYLDRARQQFDPFQRQGQEAYGQLNPIYSQMAQDPAAFLQSLMQGYEASPAYQQKFGQMSQAAANTAAAGGMRGSLQDIQNTADISRSLMGEDMQQWLQNVMGLQGAGMGGLQDFYNKGYGASGDIANVLGSQGSLAFQGQANQNKSMMDMLSGILSGVGGFAGSKVGGNLLQHLPGIGEWFQPVKTS